MYIIPFLYIHKQGQYQLYIQAVDLSRYIFVLLYKTKYRFRFICHEIPYERYNSTWSVTDEVMSNKISQDLEPFNSSPPSAAYMRRWIVSALVMIITCHLFGAKPFSKPILGCCQLGTEVNCSEILIKNIKFSFTKMHPKISSAKWRPFCPGGDDLNDTAEMVFHMYMALVNHTMAQVPAKQSWMIWVNILYQSTRTETITTIK